MALKTKGTEAQNNLLKEYLWVISTFIWLIAVFIAVWKIKNHPLTEYVDLKLFVYTLILLMFMIIVIPYLKRFPQALNIVFNLKPTTPESANRVEILAVLTLIVIIIAGAIILIYV